MSLPPDLHSWFALYIGHFAATDTDYVRQNAQGSKWTIHEPLTPEVVHESFAGGRFSVSGFLARDREGTIETHVGAIDFDTPDGFEQAEGVQRLLAGWSVGSLLVRSRRGAHVWVLSDAVIWASVMRRALKVAVVLAGYDEDPKIEVFPKKSGTAMGGGALRLPLMRHPVTGKRYGVTAADGSSADHVQGAVLLAVDQTSPAASLTALAGPEPMETSYPRWNPLYGRPRPSGDDPSITALLASVGLSSQPGRSVRCPFHDDRHASLSVADDDERAWCKAPACPLHNDGRGLGSRDLARLIEGATHAREPQHPPGP